jgi:hypothetical protein
MSGSNYLRILLLMLMLLLLLACGSTATQVPTVAPTDTPQPTNTPLPTLTPTPEPVKVSPEKNANCRVGPATDFPVQVSIPAGTQVTVLGRNADSSWYYVQIPQTVGGGCWVKGNLFTVSSGSLEILPFFTPPPMIYPTAPPAEPTPSCDRSETISIINDTGGVVTLYLTGPAKFTFRINTGNQTISVCPGTYSYTGYGCGGASKNGTASPGDEITFFCTVVP